MPDPDPSRLAKAVLRRYGQTFAEECGIDLREGSPASLFSLLCLALLCSARIGHRIALNAARALSEQGWTTPESLAASTWQQRVDVLDRAKYVRYDERTSTMLREAAQATIDLYQGDLRKLRQEARRAPESERRLLKAFKGIGDVGADIFIREVQVSWDEVYPFADRKALEGARLLGLPAGSAALAQLVRGKQSFVRLVTGLVRTRLEGTAGEIHAQAL